MGALLLAATILVSAGSSLTDVLNRIAMLYQAATGERVQVNAGASNTLARQIVEGAPVDVFVSADEAQMDVVERAGRLVPGSRFSFLANRLVAIAPANSALTIKEPRELAATSVRRIAMANPQGVPAGIYARVWLERVGVWPSIAAKVVPLPTVRAVLAAVREERADVGIVYATDARGEPTVRVVFEPRAGDARDVIYPAAVVRGANQREAARFVAYLRSKEAIAVFEAAGFSMVNRR